MGGEGVMCCRRKGVNGGEWKSRTGPAYLLRKDCQRRHDIKKRKRYRNQSNISPINPFLPGRPRGALRFHFGFVTKA